MFLGNLNELRESKVTLRMAPLCLGLFPIDYALSAYLRLLGEYLSVAVVTTCVPLPIP